MYNHRLCFRLHANVELDSDSHVEGVVWVLSHDDLKQLDLLEGCPDYYTRKAALVTIDQQLTEAWVYAMTDRNPLQLPDSEYLDLCMQGYRQNQLDTAQLETAMFFIENKPNTPKEAVALWKQTHGAADMRFYLDQYFWSYRIKPLSKLDKIDDIDEWCNRTLGEPNWFRSFDKFWFTTEQDFVMFKLVWFGGEFNG